MFGAIYSPSSKTARGCKCPKGSKKVFVKESGIRCKANRRIGGRLRNVFVKIPKKCNQG
jgi:hypothetical protein